MCSGSEPEQDYTDQNKQSDMIKWMDSNWETKFKPLIDSLLNELENKDENIRKNVDDAGVAAQKSQMALRA